MRLLQIAVRNYRLHRDLRVDLDTARTLIGGPNESGKSTLIEAAHRALFLRARTSGETQREMTSGIHGGHPEVEVNFECRGKTWHLVKRFSGQSGTVILTEAGGGSSTGDEAEGKLASLLGVEAMGGGRRADLPAQWGHIWIWQGTAGDDPAAHANAQRDALITRLQSGDGTAAMQSALDARVAGAVADLCESMFTKAGDPRAGSDLYAAVKEEEAATQALDLALETQARLEQAVQDFQQAERARSDAAAALESLRPQLQAAEAKLAHAAELRSGEKMQMAALSLAVQTHGALVRAAEDIHALREDVARRREILAPGESEVQRAADVEAECRRRESTAEQAALEAGALVRAARLRRDLAAAHLQRLERAAELDALTKKRQDILTVRKEHAALLERLAQFPAVTDAALKKLQALDRDCSNAESALNAMAAGLEVTAADLPVAVNGQLLMTGMPQIITEEVEITVGRGVRLRIWPGKGTSLTAARQRVREAVAARQRAFDELSVSSLPAAAEACHARQQVESELKSIAARLEGMGDSRVDAEGSAAEKNAAAAGAEVERLGARVTDFPAPATLTDARALAADCSLRLSREETGETSARAAREAAARATQTASALHAQARAKVEEQRREITAADAKLEYLLSTYGNDDARIQALAELGAVREAAEKQLAATRQSLAELQPDLLEAELKNLHRTVERHTSIRIAAETKRAVAQSALVRDGTNDPEANVAIARERALAAAERRAGEERRAGAIQLLHGLFLTAKHELAEQFTRPLAEKVSGYLECLFGPGARAAVRLVQDQFTSLQLVRPSHAAGAFDFHSLSGGTREQLAAAFRLAMAEVLAAAHDGCLPVVFDDAFAYADPERVQILHRMLDLAASRGLQIIVMTCNPADYAALGAKQIFLPPAGNPLP